MNDETTGASPQPNGDREEIARLLPAPADWDLPREQHLRHKDLLMHHIDREQSTRSRPARRLLRPALLAPATALTLAGVLAAGIALHDGAREPAGTSLHDGGRSPPAPPRTARPRTCDPQRPCWAASPTPPRTAPLPRCATTSSSTPGRRPAGPT